jgi:hypothetical protein
MFQVSLLNLTPTVSRFQVSFFTEFYHHSFETKLSDFSSTASSKCNQTQGFSDSAPTILLQPLQVSPSNISPQLLQLNSLTILLHPFQVSLSTIDQNCSRYTHHIFFITAFFFYLPHATRLHQLARAQNIFRVFFYNTTKQNKNYRSAYS